MPRTERLVVDPRAPDGAAIDHAARVLARGGLVAFPTETVYGLGALALDPRSVTAIYTAKGRPASNPVIVHVDRTDDARSLAAPWTALADALALAFWPGPLTLVVGRGAAIPVEVSAGGSTVALRSPSHAVARALLVAVGAPIAAPSANASSAISPTTADHVLRSLDGRIDLVLDGGACPSGIESTVVDATGEVPRVLRPGVVTRDAIARALSGGAAACGATGRAAHAVGGAGSGQAGGNRAEFRQQATDEPARSPGLLAQHYAPSHAKLELVEGAALVNVVAGLRAEGRRVRALVYSHSLEGERLADDAEGYAAGLYAALHRLDSPGVDRIVVERPPASPAWEAIYDRLTRAAAERSEGE